MAALAEQLLTCHHQQSFAPTHIHGKTIDLQLLVVSGERSSADQTDCLLLASLLLCIIAT